MFGVKLDPFMLPGDTKESSKIIGCQALHQNGALGRRCQLKKIKRGVAPFLFAPPPIASQNDERGRE